MPRSQVCSPESRKYDRRLLSSDVIGKELSAERLSASCLGLSFEGMDFVTDALVSPPHRVRFGREWLANICETAELAQAQFCSAEAFTALAALALVFSTPRLRALAGRVIGAEREERAASGISP